MNWDQIKGNWLQVKGKVKEKWGDLTDDDLARLRVARSSSPVSFKSATSQRTRLQRQVDEWASKL
jgi:hypothetical protein